MRGPGRPQHPVTLEDCQRWLREELELVTQRYNEKLERVRRAQSACDVVEDVARVYADVADGDVDAELQAMLIDRAFMSRGFVLRPDELASMDVPKMQVQDEGATRLAMRVVAAATGITSYALAAQRAHRARARASNPSALVRCEPDEDEPRGARCA